MEQTNRNLFIEKKCIEYVFKGQPKSLGDAAIADFVGLGVRRAIKYCNLYHKAELKKQWKKKKDGISLLQAYRFFLQPKIMSLVVTFFIGRILGNIKSLYLLRKPVRIYALCHLHCYKFSTLHELRIAVFKMKLDKENINITDMKYLVEIGLIKYNMVNNEQLPSVIDKNTKLMYSLTDKGKQIVGELMSKELLHDIMRVCTKKYIISLEQMNRLRIRDLKKKQIIKGKEDFK